MYSLPLGLNFTTTAHYWGSVDAADYEVRPTTPWAYALDADPADPAATLSYRGGGYTANSAPFNHTNWPCRIEATVRQLPPELWGEFQNGAGLPPASPVCRGAAARQCGEAQSVSLVPHGATVLRIGSMPLSGFTGDADFISY